MAEPDTRSYTVAQDSSVYYGGGYWNDLPQVAAYIERRATGKPDTDWYTHLKDVTGGRTFRKALFLNCGNGWVERQLLEAGIVEEAVGTDISDELLDQARKAAAVAGLPARYYARDINTADLPEDGYDLVVNFAAAHHIAYLDKVLRRVCEVLPADGVFASVDYVGPHRNQYGYAQWQAAQELVEQLPEAFRSAPNYPHLPTMLAGDPTEAIHSELILDTVRRYFRLEELNPIGGALAYPVLSFNSAVHGTPGPERDAVVEQVLAADEAWTTEDPDRTLFAFFWGHPMKAVLDEQDTLAAWAREEEAREQAAAAAEGRYYPLTVLQQLTQELETLRMHNSHLLADLHRTTDEKAALLDRRVALRPVLVRTLDERAHLAMRLLRGLRRLLGRRH
jgi:SAM-dependent methyltransferase